MNTEKRYLVYNKTDGVLAHSDAMTLDEATAFVQAFAHRYARQGYYLTAQRERIRPEDAALTIIRVDAAAKLPAKQSARKPTGPRRIRQYPGQPAGRR